MGAMQEIDHVGAAGDLFLKRRGAGCSYSVKPIDRDHREDVDELAVAVRVLGQAFAQPRHRRRQVPVLERGAIA